MYRNSLKNEENAIDFAIGDGINKSQGFTNAPFKGVWAEHVVQM